MPGLCVWHLTDAGRDRVTQLAEISDRLEDEMTKGFDGKDKKRLRRLLRKASKNLAKASGRKLDATALLDADDGDDSDALKSGRSASKRCPHLHRLRASRTAPCATGKAARTPAR